MNGMNRIEKSILQILLILPENLRQTPATAADVLQ
jgi:hypothetical protein